MILALVLALATAEVVPPPPATNAPAAANAPPTVISVAVTPPPKPARICHQVKQVGSLLPVKVCARAGESDGLDQLQLLQQKSYVRPRE